LLQQVALIAKPDNILGWYRRLIAQKFDGSKHRTYPGRRTMSPKIVKLVLRMARENPGWGYDRIVARPGERDWHLGAGQAQVASLGVQVGAAGRLRLSLEERLELLQRKRAQFALLAPVAGTVFGEDLPRMKGRYLSKGAEICRVAYTLELLARVQVPEQALGDVAVGNPVRLKTRSHPDRLFHAVVSRIGGESEPDADGRRSYRVELTVKNSDGLLRDGMTVFARVDYGTRPIAWLLAHKLRQALRPEIWML